jgi:hypothetical protein
MRNWFDERAADTISKCYKEEYKLSLLRVILLEDINVLQRSYMDTLNQYISSYYDI